MVGESNSIDHDELATLSGALMDLARKQKHKSLE
jgi:hypothetical protein